MVVMYSSSRETNPSGDTFVFMEVKIIGTLSKPRKEPAIQ